MAKGFVRLRGEALGACTGALPLDVSLRGLLRAQEVLDEGILLAGMLVGNSVQGRGIWGCCGAVPGRYQSGWVPHMRGVLDVAPG